MSWIWISVANDIIPLWCGNWFKNFEIRIGWLINLEAKWTHDYFFYIFLLLLIDLFHRFWTCSAYDVVRNTCAHKIWAARNLFKLCVATKNRDNGNLKLPSVINVQATLNTYFANWWILYFMPNRKRKREKKTPQNKIERRKKPKTSWILRAHVRSRTHSIYFGSINWRRKKYEIVVSTKIRKRNKSVLWTLEHSAVIVCGVGCIPSYRKR